MERQYLLSYKTTEGSEWMVSEDLCPLSDLRGKDRAILKALLEAILIRLSEMENL